MDDYSEQTLGMDLDQLVDAYAFPLYRIKYQDPERPYKTPLLDLPGINEPEFPGDVTWDVFLLQLFAGGHLGWEKNGDDTEPPSPDEICARSSNQRRNSFNLIPLTDIETLEQWANSLCDIFRQSVKYLEDYEKKSHELAQSAFHEFCQLPLLVWDGKYWSSRKKLLWLRDKHEPETADIASAFGMSLEDCERIEKRWGEMFATQSVENTLERNTNN